MCAFIYYLSACFLPEGHRTPQKMMNISPFQRLARYPLCFLIVLFLLYVNCVRAHQQKVGGKHCAVPVKPANEMYRQHVDRGVREHRKSYINGFIRVKGKMLGPHKDNGLFETTTKFYGLPEYEDREDDLPRHSMTTPESRTTEIYVEPEIEEEEEEPILMSSEELLMKLMKMKGEKNGENVEDLTEPPIEKNALEDRNPDDGKDVEDQSANQVDHKKKLPSPEEHTTAIVKDVKTAKNSSDEHIINLIEFNNVYKDLKTNDGRKEEHNEDHTHKVPKIEEIPENIHGRNFHVYDILKQKKRHSGRKRALSKRHQLTLMRNKRRKTLLNGKKLLKRYVPRKRHVVGGRKSNAYCYNNFLPVCGV